MASSAFDSEQVRLATARRLPAHCYDEFLRLSRTLVHGPVFQWLLVDAPDDELRKQVMGALDEVLRAAGLSTNRLPLSNKIADVGMLEARLVKNAKAAAVVHVVGRQGWFDAARWDAFNARRERLAAQARARLVFWLDAEAIALASRGAPDLWAWRGGVYAFVPDALHARSISGAVAATGRPATALRGNVFPFTPRSNDFDNRSMAERSVRVAELRAWLARMPLPPDELLVGAAEELGRLLFTLGDYEAALEHLRKVELPLFRRLGDVQAETVTRGQIADILQARGQLDEALRIREEEQLPVVERLGDVREKAITMGKIADILRMRGQLDEALRIYKEELLPVFERIGDVRGRAVTMDRIADILVERGQLDEALRIYKEEQLPVFERLVNLREKAITMGRIADILVARGQLDEALRIHREEEIPVYERLGDQRERAVTMGRIAGILQLRGQFDEALRIHREEQLPVYERLGYVREKALTQWKIGMQLLRSGDAKSEAPQLLGDAYRSLTRMGLPEAAQLAEQMQECGVVLPDI